MKKAAVIILLAALIGAFGSFIFSRYFRAGPPANSADPDELAASGSASEAEDDDSVLFEVGHVARLQLEIPRAGMATLSRYHWQWGGNEPERKDVMITVREAGRVYTNVAVHLKGSAGSFRPIGDKSSFTLNFSKFAPGQRFHGLKKLHLNNSVQDSTFLCEKICRELFSAAGIPAPRAGHAVVELNGRRMGLYVLVEGWNKQFLKRHFKDDRGTLYDGGFAKEITFPLEIDAGDENSARDDLAALARAAQEPKPAARLQRMDRVLDVDRFLTFMAMEVLVGHTDGYCMNHNNYRVYYDAVSDRLIFLPHGMDQMFGVWQPRLGTSITPPMRGLVARAVLFTPEGRTRYLERLGQLSTNVFRPDEIVQRIEELAAKLRPVIKEEGLLSVISYDQSVASLQRRVQRRAAMVRQQLNQRNNPLQVSPNGEIRLTDWKPKRDRENATFSESTDASGHKLLKIQLPPGGGLGSWRSQVLLEAGDYRLAGRVKTDGLVVNEQDAKAGVGLRISGSPFSERVTGSTGWREVSCEFSVPGVGEVELVCECRGTRGEAVFDAASLRLIRVGK